VIAWRFARRVRVRHIRRGIRAVAAGAAVILVLLVARAVMISSYAAGVQAAGRAAVPIAAVQGAAVIAIVAGITVPAWFPALAPKVHPFRPGFRCIARLLSIRVI
jgi:hypothetical protein